MALTIMTNTLALAARRQLSRTNERLHKVIERLASGKQIIRASDDAAGLAISDQLNAEIRSLTQGIKNSLDGISLIQVYEGGTTEINNMLTRMRELAMRAASDTVGEKERMMLDAEVQQIKAEIDRIAKTTRFVGHNLLNGEAVKLEFQVGTKNDPELDRIVFEPGETDLTAAGLGVDDVNVREKETAAELLDIVDQALFKVNDTRARVGSVQSRLQTTVTSQEILKENMLAAKSRIRDADIAVESSKLARESILRKAGIAVLMQANETPSVALKLLS